MGMRAQEVVYEVQTVFRRAELPLRFRLQKPTQSKSEYNPHHQGPGRKTYLSRFPSPLHIPPLLPCTLGERRKSPLHIRPSRFRTNHVRLSTPNPQRLHTTLKPRMPDSSHQAKK